MWLSVRSGCTVHLPWLGEALSSAEDKMKRRFDRRAVERQFKPGDEVLVLFPTSGSALAAQFSGGGEKNVGLQLHHQNT